MYDPEADTWSEGPDLREGRYRHGCANLGFALYVAGGEGRGWRTLRSVERLDPGSGSWERVKDMIQPRKCFSLTALGGKLYAAGGLDGRGNEISSVECYDPVSDSWSEVSSLPQGKYGMGSVTVRREDLGLEVQGLYQGNKGDTAIQPILTRMGNLLESDFCL